MNSSLVIQVLRFSFGQLGRIAPNLTGHLAYKLWFKTSRSIKPFKQEQILQNTAQKFTLKVNKKDIQVFIWGSPGPIILLLHGWGGRATLMGHFIDPFVKLGYQVVAFDAPAHGQSSGNYTDLFEYAKAIQLVVDKFGCPYGIIAHSAGVISGTIALRKGLICHKVVCISSPCKARDLVDKFANSLHIPSQSKKKMIQLFERDYGKDIWDYVSVDCNAKHLKMPAMIIHDRDDKEIPFEDGIATAAAWKDSQFIETSNLGHRRIILNKNIIQKSVDFITTN